MAATLQPNRPGQGKKGGQCVAYAGITCFGIRFGADLAKEIWTNTKTNTGAALPYTKYNTMPSLPCCIVWDNSPSGHVGVIESSTGTGVNKRYRYSDSNRVPGTNNELVDIKTSLTEEQIKALIAKDKFKGYVKFN